MSEAKPTYTRRDICSAAARFVALGGLGGGLAALAWRNGLAVPGDCSSPTDCADCAKRSGCGQRRAQADFVWQIDPDTCNACGLCQTHCVLDQSAVKAVQCFALCGYCDVCTGYFPTTNFVLETGAENHLCPTDAVRRKFIEEKSGERFFEYTVEEDLCIGCGKCVEGCRLMNGSLYLQVRHDVCVNCSECALAVACPTKAFRRVPAESPYLLGRAARAAEESLRRKRESGGTSLSAGTGRHAPERSEGRGLSPTSPATPITPFWARHRGRSDLA